MEFPQLLPEYKKVGAFFLLPDCDIRCTFCITHNDFDIVDFDRAARFMELLADSSIDSVVIGGGEPLLWPHDVGALAQHANDLGLTTQLNTHGGGLLDRFDDLHGLDRFILPVESMDPAVHDNLRRGRVGHHAMVMKTVEEMISRGRQLTFATVVTSENCAGIGGIAAWIGELEARGARVHAWHLYNFLPEGRGGSRKIAEHLAIPREDFLAGCATAKGAGLDCAVYRRDDMLRSSTVEFFWFEQGKLCMGGAQLARA
ncbi:MAG: MoaA/NifB/PqqE/SkfB family radical SAM enzyme [Planctomycetota bacterium]|jgi:MoaA/NifB/PqqE/SkfB family radical SAM enzyme